MVFDLLLIALVITLDPLPLMAFVLVVASPRGVWKGLAFILGWLACFVVVIALVLSLTGGQPPPPRSPPSTAVLSLKLAIGVGLVLYGAYRHRRPVPDRVSVGAAAAEPSRPGSTGSEPSPDVARAHRGSLGSAAGLAMLLQPWGLVAAGAVTIVEADASHLSTWLVLFAFCVLATASLIAAELYVVFAPDAAQQRLLALRTWMESREEQAIVVGSLIVGLWLTGKSIYELTG
ncbi:GAP family protein [Streptomyces sp. NPDC002328]|uniref:GAP family protein n=1 Tax=Streptomyces sp. NPDC002328 TaxID=3364642 RepID=UPI00367F0488